MRPRRSTPGIVRAALALLVGGGAIVAVVSVAGGTGAGTAPTMTDAPTTTTTVPVAPLATRPTTATSTATSTAGAGTTTTDVDPDERAKVQQGARDLVSAWGGAGGTDGFPFWAKQYRAATTHDAKLRALIAATSADDLGQYTDAYLQLLNGGVNGVDQAEVPDELERAHGHLQRALELRIAALESLRRLLDREGDDGVDVDAMLRSTGDCADDSDCAAFASKLDRSYRSTRIATAEVQQALAQVGAPAVPETSFT